MYNGDSNQGTHMDTLKPKKTKSITFTVSLHFGLSWPIVRRTQGLKKPHFLHLQFCTCNNSFPRIPSRHPIFVSNSPCNSVFSWHNGRNWQVLSNNDVFQVIKQNMHIYHSSWLTQNMNVDKKFKAGEIHWRIVLSYTDPYLNLY